MTERSLDAAALIERAIRWGEERLGDTSYAYLCLGFVEDCYERGGGVVLDGYADAKETADAYQAAAQAGPSPRGAYVLYDCTGPINGQVTNWGHVGISLGDGRVLHAWDRVRIDDYRAIERLQPGPGWTPPAYIGWAGLNWILSAKPRA